MLAYAADVAGRDEEIAQLHAHVSALQQMQEMREIAALGRCQYLYVCTSKASKLLLVCR
jgi:hypothetical protein